ncbi:MAG: hypothetical protein DSY37_03180 [Hyperthermus sp.]|uniref:Uncharacterized protein n=1 Tax=Hyperthermus sp. TaxID=1970083 RepID=A0ACD6BAJ4_9CREN|nr:MAG: hypothetical protein DSY37_03180 [Hyperthermus sp.]
MKKSSSGAGSLAPLAALAASAIALALFTGYASVTSDRTYYGYGDVSVKNEPVNVVVSPFSFPGANASLSSGGQGVFKKPDWIRVVNQSDVENVKLEIDWVNANQAANYFDYARILVTGPNGQVKGYLSLQHGKAWITLDAEELREGAVLGAVMYYEVKEGVLASRLPLVFKVRVVETG